MRRNRLFRGKRSAKYLLAAAPVLILIGLMVWFMSRSNVQLLNPAGTIGLQERRLMYISLGVALIVVLPVFGLLFGFAWKYRAGNAKAIYRPEWDHGRILETTWWLIPGALILVLGIITWQSTHALDPYRSIGSATPLTIQVVALQWKWLFIYPDQGVASVNELRLPVNTPVTFHLTADAPMNSFWIPQLGGQVYAMSGMSTQLHLQAMRTGSYAGSSANISGRGFAGMKFMARVNSQADFDAWVRDAGRSRHVLDQETYRGLAQPGENMPVTTYALRDPKLYEAIMAPYSGHGTMSHSHEREMLP